MRHRDYVDQIIRAAALATNRAHPVPTLIDQLAKQLADNEHTKDALRRKGYGQAGMSACDSANLVPPSTAASIERPQR